MRTHSFSICTHLCLIYMYLIRDSCVLIRDGCWLMGLSEEEDEEIGVISEVVTIESEDPATLGFQRNELM